jgi:hypothetical protein
MVVVTTVTINRSQLNKSKDFLKKHNKEIKKLPHAYAKRSASNMRRQVLMQQKKAPRNKAANNIRAVKLSGVTSAVKMPLKLIYLDRMKPHYVSLKRGRAITRWARKYYDGTPRSAGRSRVRRGPRGGIKGFLYVTPDPFIRTAQLRTDKWFVNHVNTMFNRIK